MLALKAGLLLALICAGLMRLKKWPWLGFGILWFFIVLLPTNSLIPRLDVANERQLYLSSYGIFLVAAMACAKLAVRAGKNSVYWTMAAILVVLACVTISRNQVYRSEIALWEDTARKSPHKPRAFNNLGYAYFLAGRNEDAEKAYRQALHLKPDYKPARTNLESLRKNLERD